MRASRPRSDHRSSRTQEWGLLDLQVLEAAVAVPAPRREPGRGSPPRAEATPPRGPAALPVAARHPFRGCRRQVHTRPPGPPRHAFSHARQLLCLQRTRSSFKPEHKYSRKRSNTRKIKASSPEFPRFKHHSPSGSHYPSSALACQRPEVTSAAPGTRRAAISLRPGSLYATGHFRED